MPQDVESGWMMQRPPDTPDRGSSSSRLTCLGFAALTFNSSMAIYRSKGDPASIAFVASSYVALVLLFSTLRIWEREGDCHTNSWRRRVRMSVWVLTALLAVMLCYKVATVMPLPMAAVVWAMAGAALVGIFYAFFARRN